MELMSRGMYWAMHFSIPRSTLFDRSIFNRLARLQREWEFPVVNVVDFYRSIGFVFTTTIDRWKRKPERTKMVLTSWRSVTVTIRAYVVDGRRGNTMRTKQREDCTPRTKFRVVSFRLVVYLFDSISIAESGVDGIHSICVTKTQQTTVVTIAGVECVCERLEPLARWID